MVQQGMPDAAVLFFLDLQPGKALEHLRECLVLGVSDSIEHGVHRRFDDSVLVKFNPVILVQRQIPRETSDQAVGEAVQRHDRHLGVSMQHGRAGGSGPGAKFLLRDVKLRRHFIDQRLRRLRIAQLLQKEQYALLHFARSLVCERQGQHVAKRFRLEPFRPRLQATRQVASHQAVGLSRTGRCPNNLKRLTRLHGSQICGFQATFCAN